MSFLALNFYAQARKIFSPNIPVHVSKLPNLRQLSTGSSLFNESTVSEENSNEEGKVTSKKKPYIKIPFETSIKYLKSKAYFETYGDSPVWVPYRRNFKGQYPPLKTRKTCIRAGYIATGNPCPICRDEYLVIHHENVDLLSQFISPYTGEILSYRKTGLCQKKHFDLLVAIEKAKDFGTLTFDVPFRIYDYSLYMNQK